VEQVPVDIEDKNEPFRLIPPCRSSSAMSSTLSAPAVIPTTS
jgi:hypothetical protein